MYAWKVGSMHVVDAEAAGRALEDMVARHGFLTPRLVVEESRPETAPLHDEFEWDDAVAAEKYREEQARYIIRSVVVEMPNREETFVRAFVSVMPGVTEETNNEDEEEGAAEKATPVYVRTVDALADAPLRKQVLERALKELEAWQRRYADLQEFAALFQSIEVARQQLLQPAA